MRQFHVISAKRMGYANPAYYYIPFPVDEYTKDEAIAQFKKVKKQR